MDSKRYLKNAEVAELKATLLLEARRQSEDVAVAEALLEELRQLVVRRRQECQALCWELQLQQKRESAGGKDKKGGAHGALRGAQGSSLGGQGGAIPLSM